MAAVKLTLSWFPPCGSTSPWSTLSTYMSKTPRSATRLQRYVQPLYRDSQLPEAELGGVTSMFSIWNAAVVRKRRYVCQSAVFSTFCHGGFIVIGVVLNRRES